MDHKYAAFKPVVDIDENPLPKAKRRQGNAPAYDLRSYLYQLCGVDLTQVDGIDAVIAQKVLSEIGLDMSRWPTDKHFTSWLRLAAQAVSRTQTALGAFFRRMRAKPGPAKAIIATANKIARIVYHMLKDKTAYIDRGADYYEEKYREQAIKNLKRKAAKLGMHVVPAVS